MDKENITFKTKTVTLQGKKKNLFENVLNFIKALTFSDNLTKIGSINNISLNFSKKNRSLAKKIINFLSSNNYEIKSSLLANVSEEESSPFFQIQLNNSSVIKAIITPTEKLKHLSPSEMQKLETYDSWCTLFLNMELLPF